MKQKNNVLVIFLLIFFLISVFVIPSYAGSINHYCLEVVGVGDADAERMLEQNCVRRLRYSSVRYNALQDYAQSANLCDIFVMRDETVCDHCYDAIAPNRDLIVKKIIIRGDDMILLINGVCASDRIDELCVHLNPGCLQNQTTAKPTAADARMILRMSAGLEPIENGLVRAIADTDGDGRVTARDARFTLRISAQLEFPVDRDIPLDMSVIKTNIPTAEIV